MKTKWAFACVRLGVLLSIAVLLLGCGSSGFFVSPTRFLATLDAGNNRVLIYDAPFSTGQAASVVLGQADFNTGTAATTATGMRFPAEVVVDADGNLFVADWNNCRVIQFKAPFTNGMSATLVLGEPDFTTAACATSATGLAGGTGVKIGLFGKLWVSDTGNNRVVEFTPPFSNGMAATLAIGQADLTHGSCNQGAAAPTASSLCGTRSLAFDWEGNLWVAEYDNNRVTEFKPPFATGMAASVVLGQPDFVSNTAATTATGMSNPAGLAFDAEGNLWVGEFGNNRVLEFTPPFSNGMAASLVLGQVDFTHGAINQGLAAPTDSTSWGAHGLAFDSTGRLILADERNNRTLVFAPPFSNGTAASLVIGQADFSHGSVNQGGVAPTASTQDAPLGETLF
jgi:sugar lactone lactonase YvrE